MQVELLRDLFNQAFNEPDEQTRVGCFWCFACDYDNCLPFFKEILLNKELKVITSKECVITKKGNGFLIEDLHGNADFYSFEEAIFLIDLWDKAQEADSKVNTIYL